MHVTYESVQNMGILMRLVHTEFGPGVVKRPSPADAPGAGATVGAGTPLVPGQVPEWYPVAAAGG